MEPEKKIESMLRAYGRGRRSTLQGRVTMPSTMMARLHRELDEVFHSREHQAPRQIGWLSALRFRLALGTLGVAALITLWVFRQQSDPLQQSQVGSTQVNLAAKQEPHTSFEVSLKDTRAIHNPPAYPVAPPSSESFQVLQEGPKQSKGTEINEQLASNPVRPVAASSKAEALVRLEPESIRKGGGLAFLSNQSSFNQLFQNRISVSPEARAEVSSLVSLGRERSQNRDKNDARQAAAPAAMNQVMNTFNFWQEGSIVRIEDADGSIYSGQVASVVSPTNQADFRQIQEPRVRRYGLSVTAVPGTTGDATVNNVATPPFNEISFEALGTNLSLKQKVMIQGRIGPDDLVPSPDRKKLISSSPMTQLPQAAGAAPLQSKQSPIRIWGQAMVGSNTIPLDAVPAN